MKPSILIYITLAVLCCQCRAQLPSKPPSTCQLSVPPAPPETFEDCSTVTTLDPLVPYAFYYTLIPSTTGSGTTWRGGLKIKVDAANGGAWGGFGFGPRMLGTNAVIVKKCDMTPNCTTGARIDGYKLIDYDPSSKIPGSFAIRDSAAAVDPQDGSLVATFTVDLPQPVDELTKVEFQHIAAVGPLASDGSLLPHIGADFPYTVNSYTLKSSNIPAADATTNTPTSESTSVPAAGSTTPSHNPPTCSVTDGSVLANFSTCTTLGNVLTVHWNALAPSSFSSSSRSDNSSSSSSSGGNVTLELGMSGTITANEWLALGFPATPGQMIGSTAQVLISCIPGSSPKICSPEDIQQGAVLRDYYLGDKVSTAVTPPGHLAFKDLEANSDGSGTAQGRFTVSLPAALVSNGQLNVLYARGNCDPVTGLLQHHDTRGAASLDLASGTSSTVTDTSAEAKKNAHAWLMVIGWTIILIGAVVARELKALDPLWFHIHRALQVFGLTCVLTAFILIFSALGGHRSKYTIHFNLGIAATTLGLVQLHALVFRPHLDSKYRRAWAFGHHWLGRAAILVAVANIYEGIINVKKVGSWAVISYSIVFGLIVGVGILKEGLDYLRLPPPAVVAEPSPEQRQENGKNGMDGSASGSDVEQSRS